MKTLLNTIKEIVKDLKRKTITLTLVTKSNDAVIARDTTKIEKENIKEIYLKDNQIVIEYIPNYKAKRGLKDTVKIGFNLVNEEYMILETLKDGRTTINISIDNKINDLSENTEVTTTQEIMSLDMAVVLTLHQNIEDIEQFLEVEKVINDNLNKIKHVEDRDKLLSNLESLKNKLFKEETNKNNMEVENMEKYLLNKLNNNMYSYCYDIESVNNEIEKYNDAINQIRTCKGLDNMTELLENHMNENRDKLVKKIKYIQHENTMYNLTPLSSEKIENDNIKKSYFECKAGSHNELLNNFNNNGMSHTDCYLDGASFNEKSIIIDNGATYIVNELMIFSNSDYDLLTNNLMDNIKVFENKGGSDILEDGSYLNHKCILCMNEDKTQSILIDPQFTNYANFSGLIDLSIALQYFNEEVENVENKRYFKSTDSTHRDFIVIEGNKSIKKHLTGSTVWKVDTQKDIIKDYGHKDVNAYIKHLKKFNYVEVSEDIKEGSEEVTSMENIINNANDLIENIEIEKGLDANSYVKYCKENNIKTNDKNSIDRKALQIHLLKYGKSSIWYKAAEKKNVKTKEDLIKVYFNELVNMLKSKNIDSIEENKITISSDKNEVLECPICDLKMKMDNDVHICNECGIIVDSVVKCPDCNNYTYEYIDTKNDISMGEYCYKSKKVISNQYMTHDDFIELEGEKYIKSCN